MAQTRAAGGARPLRPIWIGIGSFATTILLILGSTAQGIGPFA